MIEYDVYLFISPTVGLTTETQSDSKGGGRQKEREGTQEGLYLPRTTERMRMGTGVGRSSGNTSPSPEM